MLDYFSIETVIALRITISMTHFYLFIRSCLFNAQTHHIPYFGIGILLIMLNGYYFAINAIYAFKLLQG
jgi:hypothetical protein